MVNSCSTKEQLFFSIGTPTRLFLPLRGARFAGVPVKVIVSMSLDCVEFNFSGG